MDDLISRQAAIDAVIKRDANCGIDSAEVLRALPSAQPDRKQGKWIYGEHDISMCDGYRCDKCGFFVPWDYKYKSIDFIDDYHFCPNCGADMRGEQDGRKADSCEGCAFEDLECVYCLTCKRSCKDKYKPERRTE